MITAAFCDLRGLEGQKLADANPALGVVSRLADKSTSTSSTAATTSIGNASLCKI